MPTALEGFWSLGDLATLRVRPQAAALPEALLCQLDPPAIGLANRGRVREHSGLADCSPPPTPRSPAPPNAWRCATTPDPVRFSHPPWISVHQLDGPLNERLTRLLLWSLVLSELCGVLLLVQSTLP